MVENRKIYQMRANVMAEIIGRIHLDIVMQLLEVLLKRTFISSTENT